MLGAYRSVPDFAYPGWRLRIPGGPAGGHYKGFTHNYAAGTEIPPQDQYEADRAGGASSHDQAYAPASAPRGVYRSPGEVPPRPNASGRAMVYRGYQTQRHPGTSMSPGSFPAPFVETPEDFFIEQQNAGVVLDSSAQMPLPSPFATAPRVNIPVPNDFPQPSPTVNASTDFAAGTAYRAPQSPRPAPIVRAPRDAYHPAHQTRTGMHGLGATTWNFSVGGGSDFTSWMDQASIFPNVANKWVIGGGLLALLLLKRRSF